MKSFSNRWGFLPTLSLSCLVMTLSLSSCMNSSVSDLEQYVHKERNQTPGPIPALPEVKPFTTYAYDSTALRNPFVAENVNIAKSIEECPQVTHAKDALEMEPLDSLTLVGSLAQAGDQWALIKDSTGTVHRVKKGDYLGQNSGQIIAVADSDIVIEELVSDRMEGCLKRQVVLAASE
ncbi:pilus assembly protein PilP [Kaarinaea lacus]